MAQRLSRMKKELEFLTKEPPFGVSCWPQGGKLNCLEARLQGPQGTPYEGGVFKLEINIPDRYPFEPPQIKFSTKIYHPNIDSEGRICLDVLKAIPQGSWKPAHNLSTVLTSIQLLLSEPNPDDGLMADISAEYKHNRPLFREKAKEWVQKYARDGVVTLLPPAKTSKQLNKDTVRPTSPKQNNSSTCSSIEQLESRQMVEDRQAGQTSTETCPEVNSKIVLGKRKKEFTETSNKIVCYSE